MCVNVTVYVAHLSVSVTLDEWSAVLAGMSFVNPLCNNNG